MFKMDQKMMRRKSKIPGAAGDLTWGGVGRREQRRRALSDAD